MQTTAHILMIRPVRFEYNAQTAVNNRFQTASHDQSVSSKAMQEFDAFVSELRRHQIDVTVVQDTPEPHTPDSVFPNNWISFHDDGTICLFPMFAENRRAERKQQVLDVIHEKFEIKNTIDFSRYESENIFLEGTGSMVLDRDNKIVYACLSQRTHLLLLSQFAETFKYKLISFHSVDEQDQPIYHTNVMMCVAEEYVVICLDSIPDPAEKEKVIQTIKDSAKEIVDVSFKQIAHFAGNMLQVRNTEGKKYLVMSTQAYKSLTEQQLAKLQSYNDIIHSDIGSIETNGGGSARCMMAEIFLPHTS